MTAPTPIIKGRALPESQDYARLRETGLAACVRMGSDLWTDHNVHDPGISILEVACFALTELGYKAALPIADLLARTPDQPAKDFFTAAEILTCNPVTVLDYRKLLIDLDGVRNAWLTDRANPPAPEPPRPTFSVRCADTGQAHDIALASNPPAPGFTARTLDGLYDVTLQLEDHDQFGDLNSNVLEWPDPADPAKMLRLVLPRIEIEFPSWDFPIAAASDYASARTGAVGGIDTSGLGVTFDWTLRFETIAGEPAEFTLPRVRIIGVPDADFAAFQPQLETDDPQGLPAYLMRRTQAILQNIRTACCRLHAHRSLCEDYVRFGLVPYQEIGLCAEIRIRPQTDIEALLARLIFDIERFLAPPVRFYTLAEMFDRGFGAEEIFEGTVPEHGFIIPGELQASELKTEIHLSDIYRIILDHAEVVAVETLLATNYRDGVAQTDGEPWCLKLGGAFHLDLRLEKSRITFLRDGLPLAPDADRVQQILRDLKAQHNRPKLSLQDRDLPVPQGTVRPVAAYTSIQNDFPLVYGIGRDGLADTEPPLRRAQAKQLKGYLMFFDQILANGAAQLDYAKDLLSIAPPVPAPKTLADMPTLAVQPLYHPPDHPDAGDLPNVENLFQHFLPGPAGAAPPGDPQAAAGAGPDFDDTGALAADWATFAADPDNAHLTALREITEEEDTRLDRRNAFLDHLLARFAESFDNYGVLLGDLQGVQAGARDLIEDKQDFLENYPELSAERGKGFQLRCNPPGNSPTGWMENNVSGLRKRVSRMLGIGDVTRRPLAFETQVILGHFNIENPGGGWTFALRIGGDTVLEPPTSLPLKRDAIAAAIDVVDSGIWRQRFDITEPAPGQFGYDLTAAEGAVVAVSGAPLASRQDAAARIAEIQDFLLQHFYPEDEGFHVIEHILLRPIEDQAVTAADVEDGMFPECATEDDCPCPVRDHYSFRITIVLPFWPERFRNLDFRQYAETTIRRETPAHIVPRICWVGAKDMHGLDTCYLAWLQHAAQHQPDRTDLSAATSDLIRKMNKLVTVYPESRLHDCNNPDEGEQAVILGRSHI